MPDPMTRETVFELARLLGQLPPDQANELVAELQREQPDLYEYLHSLNRLFPNGRDLDQVTGIGLTMWQILKQSAEPPGRVTLEMVQQAGESYAAEIAHLASLQGDAREQAVLQATLGHPEPFLLAYLVVALQQTDLHRDKIDETFIQATQVLRGLLDALIASRGHQVRRPAGGEKGKGQEAGAKLPKGPGPAGKESRVTQEAQPATGEDAMARPLTEKEVFELAWQSSQITDEKQKGLVDELEQEQPALLAYFVDLEDDFPDPREYDAVLGMAITIWLIMRGSPDPPGRVTDKMIAYAIRDYYAEGDRLAALPRTARKKAATAAARNHPEPAVLDYVMGMLREQKNPPLTRKSYRRARYLLRVLLDALIAARGATDEPPELNSQA